MVRIVLAGRGWSAVCDQLVTSGRERILTICQAIRVERMHPVWVAAGHDAAAYRRFYVLTGDDAAAGAAAAAGRLFAV